MLEVTDGFHVTNYCYPDVPNCTAEALFMRIKDDIKDKFFKNAEIKYHLYKDISDFSIGEPITAAEIQNQEEAYENISIKRNLPEVWGVATYK